MNIKLSLTLPFLTLALLVISCSSLDKSIFENSFNRLMEIEGSLKIGVNQYEFGNLLRKFSGALETINKANLNEKEIQLFNLFQKSLETFKDSYTLWQIEPESEPSGIPYGYIFYDIYPIAPYYENELIIVTLVKKYNLDIVKVKKENSYTDRYYDCLDRSDSLNKIWQVATSIISEIKAIYN